MQLYGTQASPFVRHCQIALIQSGFEWELVEISMEQAATMTPTMKVPFLKDGDVTLTDSSTILKYIREKSGQTFFSDIMDFELYCYANTMLDSEINLFILNATGLVEADNVYLQKQRKRVTNGLIKLDSMIASYQSGDELTDGLIRLAVLLDWGLFRNRFSIDGLDNLNKLLSAARGTLEFQQSALPES